VLVHAAAGGVGLAACQVAKALGATVIACAGSPEKLEIAKRFGGADHAIDYTKVDWVAEVKRITKGKGADVVYDPVGMVEKSLRCVAWNGRIVVVGFAAGTIEKVRTAVVPLGKFTKMLQVATNRVLLKNCEISGLFWGAHMYMDRDGWDRAWRELLKLFKEGAQSSSPSAD
jgi:NADPH2:quinone reductase